MRNLIFCMILFFTCALNAADSDVVSADNTFDICPYIGVYCTDGDCCESKRRFSAMINRRYKDRQPVFRWTVSSDKIVKGQGEWVIEVDGCNAKEPLEVTVEVENMFPIDCPTKASYKTECSASSDEHD